jgi:hypothetical protein
LHKKDDAEENYSSASSLYYVLSVLLNLIRHIPGAVVCVQQLVRPVSQRLFQILGIQSLHIRIFVAEAYFAFLVKPPEHLAPLLTIS